jgi:hypothetical protein
MKTFFWIVGVAVILFIVLQAFVMRSTSDTEQHKYTVVRTYADFEVRKYEPAVFTSVILPAGSYRQNSGSGFRVLAGYIFGGNERNESIAMTSPVVMEMGETQRMKFMVPSAYRPDDLPAPNDPNIEVEEQPERIVAAIRFGGWADDDKIEQYKNTLRELIEREGLQHSGEFAYLGYNPPYEVVNRRNEVVVELVNFEP